MTNEPQRDLSRYRFDPKQFIKNHNVAFKVAQFANGGQSFHFNLSNDVMQLMGHGPYMAKANKDGGTKFPEVDGRPTMFVDWWDRDHKRLWLKLEGETVVQQELRRGTKNSNTVRQGVSVTRGCGDPNLPKAKMGTFCMITSKYLGYVFDTEPFPWQAVSYFLHPTIKNLFCVDLKHLALLPAPARKPWVAKPKLIVPEQKVLEFTHVTSLEQATRQAQAQTEKLMPLNRQSEGYDLVAEKLRFNKVIAWAQQIDPSLRIGLVTDENTQSIQVRLSRMVDL